MLTRTFIEHLSRHRGLLDADCGGYTIDTLEGHDVLISMPSPADSRSSVGPLRSLDITHAEHWRGCSVIFGRQLIRTGKTDVPTPTEVKPTMSRCFHGPDPISRGKTESRVIGIDPGRQICPPWVWPLTNKSKPPCAACR